MLPEIIAITNDRMLLFLEIFSSKNVGFLPLYSLKYVFCILKLQYLYIALIYPAMLLKNLTLEDCLKLVHMETISFCYSFTELQKILYLCFVVSHDTKSALVQVMS